MNLSHHYASATDRLLRFTRAVVMDDELCWFNCVPHFPGLSGYIRARHHELGFLLEFTGVLPILV